MKKLSGIVLFAVMAVCAIASNAGTITWGFSGDLGGSYSAGWLVQLYEDVDQNGFGPGGTIGSNDVPVAGVSTTIVDAGIYGGKFFGTTFSAPAGSLALHDHVYTVIFNAATIGAASAYVIVDAAPFVLPPADQEADYTLTSVSGSPPPLGPLALTATSGANGTISPFGVIYVDRGSNMTFSITAANYYMISDVLVDGSSVGPTNSYTFSNVTVNHTINATFAPAQGCAQVNLPPNGRLIFGMNFLNPANGGTNTLLSIFGTNQLTKSLNYLGADRVTLWVTSKTNYQTYAMCTDSQFYPCNSMTEWNTSSPTNPVIPFGSGMWLVRAHGAATTNIITVGGQIVMAATQQVAMVAGVQLVCYPFSSSIAISNINITGMTTNMIYINADRIGTWENNAYQFYGLYLDRLWYKCNTLTEWGNGIPATHVIQVGEGFFFIARTNEVWTETRRY